MEFSPNDHFKNKPLIYELITEYPRGPKFKECVKIFRDYGLEFDDKILLAVLTDDAASLDRMLTENPKGVTKKYTLDCAFTPLYETSLLHICAEYNHLDCAKILVKHGTSVNVKAGVDENGFGGQSQFFIQSINTQMNTLI